jgi:hypothetical protein
MCLNKYSKLKLVEPEMDFTFSIKNAMLFQPLKKIRFYLENGKQDQISVKDIIYLDLN